MKYFLSFILIFSSIFINSQNHKEAKELIDQVSRKINNAKSIVIDFTFKQGKNFNEKGVLEIKDEKYHLTFMEIKQISDSENIYTIIFENKEVLISKISDEDNLLKPSNLFNFFEKGYFFQNTVSNNDKKNTQISLIPIEENSDKKKLLITINKEKKEIFEIIEFDKLNNKTVIKINSISFNSNIVNEKFVFNRKKYQDYYIEEF